MDDSIMDGGFQSSWMELIAWLDWLQPFLYCLLGIVVVSLLLAMLDPALLCWKGFRSPQARRAKSRMPPRRRELFHSFAREIAALFHQWH